MKWHAFCPPSKISYIHWGPPPFIVFGRIYIEVSKWISLKDRFACKYVSGIMDCYNVNTCMCVEA